MAAVGAVGVVLALLDVAKFTRVIRNLEGVSAAKVKKSRPLILFASFLVIPYRFTNQITAPTPLPTHLAYRTFATVLHLRGILYIYVDSLADQICRLTCLDRDNTLTLGKMK